jgi:hypothetical protein
MPVVAGNPGRRTETVEPLFEPLDSALAEWIGRRLARCERNGLTHDHVA